MNLIVDSGGAIDLERNIDGLFRLALDHFIAGRHTLAAALKAAARKEDAATVRQLAKPSLAAWALNQVWWNDRQAFRSMLDAGSRLLAEQQASLSGRSSRVRQAVEDRQAAVERVVSLAVRALGGPDRVSPTTHQRLIATCEGLASGAVVAGAEPGRLVDVVAPAGLDTLVAMLQDSAAAAPPARPRQSEAATVTPFPTRGPRPSNRPPASTPSPDPEARKHNAEARRAAVERARREEHEAQASLARTQRALLEAKKALAAAERTANRAVERVEAARTELSEREADASRAERALDETRTQLALAERVVEQASRRATEARTQLSALEH
ncbi:MAG: hypothetical protein AB7I50_06285 [Vicinamibacterales bacterium]